LWLIKHSKYIWSRPLLTLLWWFSFSSWCHCVILLNFHSHQPNVCVYIYSIKKFYLSKKKFITYANSTYHESVLPPFLFLFFCSLNLHLYYSSFFLLHLHWTIDINHLPSSTTGYQDKYWTYKPFIFRKKKTERRTTDIL
jgi:hypothetical protein